MAASPVVLDRVGLQQLLDGLHTVGIAAEHFRWPPPDDPDRAPYRGWAPLEEVDAAVFFGRNAQILRGLDALHGMRSTGVESLFVILGPSGAGKSSFLRAGLLPRLRRDDRRFLPLPIVRPERAVLPERNQRCPRRSKLALHVFVQIGFVSPRAPCVSLLHPQSALVPGSDKADAVAKDWLFSYPNGSRRVVLLS